MDRAAPVTVQFLDKQNSELTRNVTSYLNLAVINHAHLVAPHVDCILRSIESGEPRSAFVIVLMCHIL